MSGRIPQAFVDELITRADIVEVIGSRVQLKQAGREFKACCPFHGEKTPSFTVSPDKQFYHCFGCGAHGTAIGFLMEHDRLSFVEAVEELASRMGLEVPREGGGAQSRPRASEDLHALGARAAQFYQECLKADERAVSYLRQRSLSGETAARFAIGYAPDSWNAVLRRFGENEAARRALSAAGLIIERGGAGREASGDGGFYDRFRDRIMFPIRDARGRVIAFGGRVLDRGEPKYLNSPETAIFHKGRELYGLYEARQTRQPLHRLLVVEGYMDVVRLHQAGVTYAVATLGTATTAEHLDRIFRLVPEVVFCFDGDRAGRAAAWRALENALPQIRDGRQIRFMFLPEGQDPDSLVGAEGREAFEARLEGASPLSEYLVEHLCAQVDLDHIDGRARLAAMARPLLQRIPEGVYRELLVGRLAEQIGMPAYKVAALLDEPGAGHGATATSTPRTANRSRRPTVSGAGRGSLMRQAIALLLNHPGAAIRIADVGALQTLELPGTDLLAALVHELREHPAPHKAAVLERWRDRPQYPHLQKLALVESSLADDRAAADELQGALQAMATKGRSSRRADALIEKEKLLGLSKQELLELNELLKARGQGATAAPAPDKGFRHRT
jgi:DNA primase